MRLTALYLLGVIAPTFGITPLNRHTLKLLNDEALQPSWSSDRSSLLDDDVVESTWATKLDHFNDDITDTFEQRYFTSTAYYRDNTPTHLFLCCGGEGPALQKSVLLNSVHCTGDMIELASQIHSSGGSVLLSALEHRYYGSSYPPKNTGYQYLTTPNAIADISEFVLYLLNTFSLPTSTTKVITFGGSYPGMVSAYSRLSYPSVITGSVSSSSPVQGTVDMRSYNEWTGKVLGMSNIGGSSDCQRAVVEGHEKIGHMLKTADGRGTLADAFNVCDGAAALEKQRNREVFAGDGVIYIPAQENDPSCTGSLCNVGEICSEIASAEGEEWKVLGKLAGMQNGGDCVDVDWDLRIKELQSPAAILGGTKSWMYQTCTGWGFYQTCEEGSECPYSKGYHNIDQDLEMCLSVFNVTEETVYEGVEKSNEVYGGWNLNGTRILFVNGDVDPWSTLSVTPTNEDIIEGELKDSSFWVEGASHHFWTHEILDTDGEVVNEGRERIWSTVSGWLEESTSVFSGSYADPNHPECGRYVVIGSNGIDGSVYGVDGDEGSEDCANPVPWGPLPATVDGEDIVIDFSGKGGPSDLWGVYVDVDAGILFSDGNEWARV